MLFGDRGACRDGVSQVGEGRGQKLGTGRIAEDRQREGSGLVVVISKKKS